MCIKEKIILSFKKVEAILSNKFLIKNQPLKNHSFKLILSLFVPIELNFCLNIFLIRVLSKISL